MEYKLVSGYEFEKKAQLIRLRIDSTFKELLVRLSELTGIPSDELILLELFEHPNKFIQVSRMIDINNYVILLNWIYFLHGYF